jgi:CRP-like cAMP-binding protein
MDLHEPLISYLKYFTELDSSEEEELRQAFNPQSFSKGEFVTEYGKVNNYLAFVSSGYCRVYVIDMEGNEVTIHMAGNRDFVGAISSFLTRSPSDEYVQAVTDVQLLTVSNSDLYQLYERSHRWERLGRMIMEGLFLRKQRRVISFIQQTAEERYKLMLQTKPDMLLHVPMHYIASFLGMSPETLSRVRAKMS